MVEVHSAKPASKIKTIAKPKPQGWYPRMIKISEPFDQVKPDERENITNAHASLQIRDISQGISRHHIIDQGEFHLIRVFIRVVCITQSSIEHFSGNDFP